MLANAKTLPQKETTPEPRKSVSELTGGAVYFLLDLRERFDDFGAFLATK